MQFLLLLDLLRALPGLLLFDNFEVFNLHFELGFCRPSLGVKPGPLLQDFKLRFRVYFDIPGELAHPL